MWILHFRVVCYRGCLTKSFRIRTLKSRQYQSEIHTDTEKTAGRCDFQGRCDYNISTDQFLGWLYLHLDTNMCHTNLGHWLNTENLSVNLNVPYRKFPNLQPGSRCCLVSLCLPLRVFSAGVQKALSSSSFFFTSKVPWNYIRQTAAKFWGLLHSLYTISRDTTYWLYLRISACFLAMV